MADVETEKVGNDRVEQADSSDSREIEDRFVDQQGYIIDTKGGVAGENVKLAKDGHTVLIPQPSSDPNDPLNWSHGKKHLILLVISFAALLPDFGSAVGAVTLLQQAKQWHMTEDHVNHSQSGNVFMLGAGGVFVVGLAAFFGRLPVLFWFLVVALATAAWCAGAQTFDSFMAARILNGFFSTVAQGGGLMFINDLFFFHERARKINIWSSFIILSPYLGPLFAAFITSTQKWVWAFGLYTSITGLALILSVLFVPETYYNRHIPVSQRQSNGNRIATLIGIHQRRVDLLSPNTFWSAMARPLRVIVKPTVFLTCIYYALTFAWVVGINTTLSIFLTPLYDFGTLQIGYFYFTPIVAAILGEVVGHWLHDAIARRYVGTHQGHFEPEVRLRATVASTPFMIAGLVGLGFALNRGYQYMVTSVCWGLYVFGIMITTVCVNAYNLDCYPEASGEVAAWLNFARTVGGFVISYVQVEWASSMGTDKTFAIQAGVLTAAFGIIFVLMAFGKTMRIRSGKINLRTD